VIVIPPDSYVMKFLHDVMSVSDVFDVAMYGEEVGIVMTFIPAIALTTRI
jgi:hypothetical protein